MKRRAFLQHAATGLGASLFLPSWLEAAHRSGAFKLGFQSWVVREPLNADFAGTLKKMAGYGYESMEMCSPLGYGSFGFGGLAKMPVPEIKKTLDGEGITCISSHFTYPELTKDLMSSVEFAHELGLEQMVVSATNVNQRTGTLDDWKKAADTMNEWGRKIKENGLPFGFHNHHFEFVELEGQLVYDMLMERLDPEVVGLQFQVAVVDIGYHAADYFRKYPGRFVSAHLADWADKETGHVPLGQGKVDWPDFLEAAKVGGLKNVYVEMDPKLLPESARYLQSLWG